VAVVALIYRAPQKFIHNFERLKIFGVITRSSKMPVLSFFLYLFISLSSLNFSACPVKLYIFLFCHLIFGCHIFFVSTSFCSLCTFSFISALVSQSYMVQSIDLFGVFNNFASLVLNSVILSIMHICYLFALCLCMYVPYPAINALFIVAVMKSDCKV